MARAYLAVDCGSTTTKAVLVEDGRLVARGEAPTTVEAPFEDVMVGWENARREVEELSGRRVDGLPRLATCSAGGGLQVLVAGLIRRMSADSAERAALGAGAIVTGVVALDDGRPLDERIARIRRLRPDMILLAGGIEGGTVTHVAQLAELIAAARPRPRLGGHRVPLIYAGNAAAVAAVRQVLTDRVDLYVVANLRPAPDQENLEPARSEIHRLFLTHVMAQAPGYERLSRYAAATILPTPSAVGLAVEAAARTYGVGVACVDIGGATTDVFSSDGGRLHRTVSANLGMSYSLRNVLALAGMERVLRWFPGAVAAADVRDRVANKTIRPTSIPATMDDLLLEQALAREALRLALEQHRSLNPDASAGRQGGLGELFARPAGNRTTTGNTGGRLLIGSGGVLSHAPRRAQAAMMLVDAYEPVGVAWLAVDDRFLLPQVGILQTVDPAAAASLFSRDCLVWLGSVLALPDRGRTLRLRLRGREWVACPGELVLAPLPSGESVRADVRGLGPVLLRGGEVGVILDCRGRPLKPTPALARSWLRVAVG